MSHGELLFLAIVTGIAGVSISWTMMLWRKENRAKEESER